MLFRGFSDGEYLYYDLHKDSDVSSLLVTGRIYLLVLRAKEFYYANNIISGMNS